MIPYMVGKFTPNSTHFTKLLVKYVSGRGYFRAVPSQNGDKFVTSPPFPIVERVNVRSCNADGHFTFSIDWLKLSTNVSSLIESGHTAMSIDLLKSEPNVSCVDQAGTEDMLSGLLIAHRAPTPSRPTGFIWHFGHRPKLNIWNLVGQTTLMTGWLKLCLNVSCCREGGHTTSSIDWSKSRPNVSYCIESGHTTP